MTISRRKLITSGLATAAGSPDSPPDRIARRSASSIDSGTVYGPGETLTYAAQRLITRHTLAREFPRSKISEKPFANALAPANDNFKKLQAGGFADWRLVVDGMVNHPLSLSLADLHQMPAHSQITEVVWKRAGPTSPNGSARRSITFSTKQACIRKPATSSTAPSSPISGEASIWPTPSIPRPSSPWT